MENVSQNITLILLVIALLIGCFCLWQIWTFKRIKKIFFKSSTGSDLESVIFELKTELKDLRNDHEILQQAFLALKDKSTFCIQRMGLVRFNPFKDGGGNFSFSLALMDDNQNGVILTSMYGREQNRIYTKKIENGKSESQLTEEELKAVNQANTNF